jgi:hypothetical protein
VYLTQLLMVVCLLYVLLEPPWLQFLLAVYGAGPPDPHPEHPGQADHGERVQHTHPGQALHLSASSVG